MAASLAFNVALDHSKKSWDALVQRWIANPPAGLLLLDSFGYSNAESKAEATARVLQIARILPNTHITYRLFIPNRDNPNNGDNHQLFLAPDAWADAQPREFIGTRVRLLVNNEPTHWDFQRTADWLLAVAKVAKARGFKVALGGFSVGGYEPDQIPMLDELLRYMAANPGLAWLCCHEYFKVDAYGEVAPGVRSPSQWPTQVNPDALWLMGRYKRILAHCDREGIPRPRIQIGEWGPDKIDGVGGGIQVCRPIWASYGFDPDWYHAEMLKWANKTIYTEDEIEFLAYYQLSDPDSGNWAQHNAGAYPRFMAETTKGYDRMTTPIPPTVPTFDPYPVGPRVLNIVDTRYSEINLRAADGSILTEIPDGATITVIAPDTARMLIGGRWYDVQKVRYGAHEGVIALTSTFNLDVIPVTPDTITRAQLLAWADKLDAISADMRAKAATL